MVLFVFILGSTSYVVSYTDIQNDSIKLTQTQQNELQKRAANISDVVTYKNNYIFSPSAIGFIDECKEKVTPNSIQYSAYNVFDFGIHSENSNPYFKDAQYGLNWAFVITIILSFVTFLFAFDAVTGEKENHTLSLVFSNKVSKGLFILSKFFSIVISVFSIVIVGAILSLLIVLISGKIPIGWEQGMEICGFLLLCLLFISTMAIIGLLASIFSKETSNSLLICLTIWIFIVVIVPNSSLFFAKKIFTIPSAKEINTLIDLEKQDINKNAPEGSWNARSKEPFYPAHELRANNLTNLMNAEKRHKDAYYNQLFNQFESTRTFGILSPITQFEYISEGILGGGYVRFQKNWNDIHLFQESFLKWFKDIDAKDEKSPHWYNPYENFSTSNQSVAMDQIPIYTEKKASLSERIIDIRTSLIAMLILLGIFFIICLKRFLKYDMR